MGKVRIAAVRCMAAAAAALWLAAGFAQSPAVNPTEAADAKAQQQQQAVQPLNNQPVWSEIRSGQPQFTTLPVRIFGYTHQAIETWLVAICSIAIIFTVFLIWVIKRVLGLERIFYAGKA